MTSSSHTLLVDLYPWLDRLWRTLYARTSLFSTIKPSLQAFASYFSPLESIMYDTMSTTVSKLTYFLHAVLVLSFSALMYLYAHPGLLIIATLFSTWIFASYMYSTRTPVPSHFLAALGAVIIPTTSRWPSYYTARMRAALHTSRPLLSASRPKKTGLTTTDSTSEVLLELDMDILLMDIAAGLIELRSPDNHLQTLLAGRDIVYTVCEEAGYSTLRIRLVAGFAARARAWYTDISARALPVRLPTHLYARAD